MLIDKGPTELAIHRTSAGNLGDRVRFCELRLDLGDKPAYNHVAVRHTGLSSSDSNASFREEVQSFQ